MNARRLVAALLLHCYPGEWRKEYGEELRDILESQPPTVGIVFDVVVSGLRQRVRTASPSTILGLASMLVVSIQFSGAADGLGAYLPPAVRPSGMTFPPLRVTLLGSELWVYVGIACGYWIEARRPGPPSRAGAGAMRMCLIGASPVIVAGLLIAVGFIDETFAGGLGRNFTPSALSLIVSPLAGTLPFWIWGSMGGWIRQAVIRRRASRRQTLT